MGITRAMEKLYLSNAASRMLRGDIQWNLPSRFIGEIPEHLLSVGGNIDNTRQRRNEKLYAGERDTFSKYSSYQTGYSSSNKRNIFSGNPYISKAFGSETKISESVTIGDKVVHAKFGTGEVIDLVKENDIVSIKFDNETFGVRKLKLTMAGLKKIN